MSAVRFLLIPSIVVLACLLGLPSYGLSSDPGVVDGTQGHGERSSSHEVGATDHGHMGHAMLSPGWEGSETGIAYSERNHHIAGWLVLLMGVAELSHALRLTGLSWAKVLLPAAMTATGLFLMIWSDHEAWPIGTLSFSQTFFGNDHEIVQHKAYGLLALLVGSVEIARRFGRMGHAAWATPLPLLAIVGGLMLFGHSHGDHPAAQKIALHHAVMGALAITAGSSKLWSTWRRAWESGASKWEVLWACLILVIGAQLLIYSE